LNRDFVGQRHPFLPVAVGVRAEVPVEIFQVGPESVQLVAGNGVSHELLVFRFVAPGVNFAGFEVVEEAGSGPGLTFRTDGAGMKIKCGSLSIDVPLFLFSSQGPVS